MKKLYYGSAYYPEHRNDREFINDLELLQKAGISAVRMGEFAWCRFEPNDPSLPLAPHI